MCSREEASNSWLYINIVRYINNFKVSSINSQGITSLRSEIQVSLL